MTNKMTLEEKFQHIKEKLGQNTNIYFHEVEELFPNMQKSSLYWTLSKLVENGYLNRVRNGIYSMNELKWKRAIFLSNAAQTVQNLLDETGFNYYISGIDVISKFLHHVPEKYPLIIFVEKVAYEKLSDLLSSSDFYVVRGEKISDEYERNWTMREKNMVVLNPTDSFAYANQSIATIEKAFIDLFFEISRNQYPMSLQELVRTYENMTRVGAIDKKKLIKTAYVRNLQYDLRFIVESKYITEEAIRFVDIMKKGV